MIEFLLPKFTDVLSTPALTQLLQQTPNCCNVSSIFAKMSAAVEPLVMHMSRSWTETPLGVNRHTVSGFILSKPVSFDPSIAIEYGFSFISATSFDLKYGFRTPLTMQVVSLMHTLQLFENLGIFP